MYVIVIKICTTGSTIRYTGEYTEKLKIKTSFCDARALRHRNRLQEVIAYLQWFLLRFYVAGVSTVIHRVLSWPHLASS